MKTFQSIGQHIYVFGEALSSHHGGAVTTQQRKQKLFLLWGKKVLFYTETVNGVKLSLCTTAQESKRHLKKWGERRSKTVLRTYYMSRLQVYSRQEAVVFL